MATHIAPIIGYHHAPLSQKFGAPRQPNLVALTSVIEMVAPYHTPDAFVGLEDFSHIWISWQFHHNDKAKKNSNNQAPVDANHNNSRFRPQVRPPRLGGNQKIGVFASRSMYRPSGLGLSVVKLEHIVVLEGRTLLIISGADMIDATPILDIKPYVAYSDALTMVESGFASAAPTSLTVSMSESATDDFTTMVMQNAIENAKVNDEVNCNSAIQTKSNFDNLYECTTLEAIINTAKYQLVDADLEPIKALIAQDPRPAYRHGEINTVFTMRYKAVDVSFLQVALGHLEISAIKAVPLK